MKPKEIANLVFWAAVALACFLTSGFLAAQEGWNMWAQLGIACLGGIGGPILLALLADLLLFGLRPFILGIGYFLDWATKPGWRAHADDE